ncbi:hypothetical protein B0T21DRAFT_412728 [Apiosordaria backusii]|uniref:Uncharacterized protein n=1 Tax=Apiosordaria backusii TaxID=314023 RepID=A0AA40BE18_9PEZI|nr:hypothetical protein B0T21DRAFT_412728 [Apiosordaria backusii]
MASNNIKREPMNNMVIPLRLRETPRPQVQPQQAAGTSMMLSPGPSRHGNASYGVPSAPRVGPWDQMIPSRSTQGHPGVHYGPIPVQGTPQDRFRREVLGHGREEVVGRPTPTPTRTQLSLRSSGAPQPDNPDLPSDPGPSANPTAPQQLSYACQARGFNPVWNEFTTPDGKFGCHVNLGGDTLKNANRFNTAKEAKSHTAKLGLAFLGSANAPPPAPSQGPVTRSRAYIAHLEASVARLKATVARLQAPATSSRGVPAHPRVSGGRAGQVVVKREQDVEMTDVPASSGGRVSSIGVAQQAELLEQIQRITGMDVINPSRESAEVTRAYLEGLAVGSRLTAAARRRSRSPTRSPQTSRVDRHRERSPLTARVRLTPPPVYERWSGRPATDRYRPDNHYRPGEDRRFRENTRASILDRESGESVESGEASEDGNGKSGTQRSLSQP